MSRGALIVLEGAEGVGKSTQLRYLDARLRAAGVTSLTVREPGGTPVGDEIRRILLESALHITPRAEALLFMASRAQLVDEVIRPALERGEFVLADRFFLATYAYQIEGRGLDATGVTTSNAFATLGLIPDLTLLLDLPTAEGFARIASRGAHDRMERSGDAFHGRVAAAFRRFATPDWQAGHAECGPIALVDARGSEEEVAGRIWERLITRWPETFFASPASHH
ncbi:MAG: dTMP kinase [Gemmatimonadaceae bacterium]